MLSEATHAVSPIFWQFQCPHTYSQAHDEDGVSRNYKICSGCDNGRKHDAGFDARNLVWGQIARQCCKKITNIQQEIDRIVKIEAKISSERKNKNNPRNNSNIETPTAEFNDSPDTPTPDNPVDTITEPSDYNTPQDIITDSEQE